MKRIIRYGGMVCGPEEYQAYDSSFKKSLKTGNWQAGEEATKFEQEASKFLGVGYGLLSSSGSCAGLLALSALELPKGSEVIICAITFPTIANIIVQQGFVPVFVDGKIGSYTMDVKEVEQAITKKTKAIIAIHPLGYPVDMPALMKVARKHGLKVIEDCCDTWGGSISGKMLGSFGDISFTSFHAAHIVSTGGIGGGTFTNDKKLAENVRMYRDWGRQANTNESNKYKSLPKDYNPRFIYEKLGYNFQILDSQAAVGRVQLRKAKKIKQMRKKNFDYLVKHLTKHGDLILPNNITKLYKSADICWFALPLTTCGERAPLVAHLEKHGIETRSMFAGNMTCHPSFKGVKYRVGPAGLTEANYVLKNSFWIGVHPRMTKDDLKYVVKIFDDYYAENK